MLHGILQVLHNPLLSDHLFNLLLRLDIKRILIQASQFPLTGLTLPLLPLNSLVIHLGEPLGVVEHGRELGLLMLGLGTQSRVTENAEADELGVLTGRARVPWLLPASSPRLVGLSHVPDMDGQHVVVGDSQFGHGL